LRAHAVLQPPGRAPLPEARGRSRRADKAEREQLPGILDYLEQVAPEDGYLVGDTITLADIAVASPFVNLGHIGVEIGARPKLRAYLDRILARPSFKHWVDRETAFLARAA
jgi:glutathione S-transferase